MTKNSICPSTVEIPRHRHSFDEQTADIDPYLASMPEPGDQDRRCDGTGHTITASVKEKENVGPLQAAKPPQNG